MGLLSLDELSGLGQPPGAGQTWQTAISTRPMTAEDHFRHIRSRYKSLYYPQPKAWHVTPEGRYIPQPRVGAGWSREGVERSRVASQGPGFFEAARYAASPAGRRHHKRLRDAARARRRKQARDLAARRARLKLQAEWNAKKNRYRGITQAEARSQRDAMIARNARLSERVRLVAARKRKEAAAALAWAKRDVRRPTTGYRTPTARGGLVRASSPYAPAPQTLMAMVR